MPVQYWLVKQEPEAYSWSQFVADKKTAWTGIRNYQARNNLRAMKPGDLVLFYHSVSEKSIVGIARVNREAYPDPTAETGDWSAVDLEAHQSMETSVTLEAVKGDDSLTEIPLIKHSRLSVMPLTPPQFKRILKLGNTKLQR